jgi:DNA-binding transcriptional MerR regulator
MQAYKVKQVALMAGISVRALHHYDQIGLLCPAYIGDNGYRYYTRDELVRLQQILFFKEMGMSLTDIGQALEKSAQERAALLEQHREDMRARAQRQLQLIDTIDKAIAELNGDEQMAIAELYKGFSEEKQADYEQWLVETYGGDMVEDIKRARDRLDKDGGGNQDQMIAQRMAELADIESELVLAMQSGVATNDEKLTTHLERHHEWVGKWWNRQPDQQSYIGLAQLYKSHPDFVARYEALAPGFSLFIVDAMEAYAKAKLS